MEITRTAGIIENVHVYNLIDKTDLEKKYIRDG